MALPETIGDGIGRRAGCRKRGDGIAIVHHVRCKSLPSSFQQFSQETAKIIKDGTPFVGVPSFLSVGLRKKVLVCKSRKL